MAATPNPRNAFDALCSIAAKENWCWKINCTTCGHMLFRYGLHELVRGKHPDAPTWIVSQSHPVLHRGGQPKELGALPPRWTPWPLEEQRQLGRILSGARLLDIRSTCRHPDWLGYLGLGLKYSEEAEQEGRRVTNAWVSQLLPMYPSESAAARTLTAILSDGQRVLSWGNLAALE